MLEQIMQLRNEGYSFQQVADQVNLSKSRVQQIYRENKPVEEIYSKFKQELEIANQRVDQLEKEVEAKEDEINDFINNIDQDTSHLDEEIESLKTALEEEKEKSQQLILNKEDEEYQYQNDYEELNDDYLALDKEHKNLQSQYDDLLKTNESLETSLLKRKNEEKHVLQGIKKVQDFEKNQNMISTLKEDFVEIVESVLDTEGEALIPNGFAYIIHDIQLWLESLKRFNLENEFSIQKSLAQKLIQALKSADQQSFEKEKLTITFPIQMVTELNLILNNN
ncbi:hypothetical protein [Flammeovirga aprica]|uniref:Uncharacterized protein n=1 Tax=Flammeovirga aprica JL-4 TaxID=694437 RepID=A0A7X9NZ48_9BACT|nr:hypothetical protein [Flammeovirga aprica]NME66591.1 hypothetical protein [Flammeovirga aprica JL-4]